MLHTVCDMLHAEVESKFTQVTIIRVKTKSFATLTFKPLNRKIMFYFIGHTRFSGAV